MQALIGIFWFIWLLVSIWLVFLVVGDFRMTVFFPEARRWWSFPAELLTLAIFAGVVLTNPF